jgi:hypothetical protein
MRIFGSFDRIFSLFENNVPELHRRSYVGLRKAPRCSSKSCSPCGGDGLLKTRRLRRRSRTITARFLHKTRLVGLPQIRNDAKNAKLCLKMIVQKIKVQSIESPLLEKLSNFKIEARWFENEVLLEISSNELYVFLIWRLAKVRCDGICKLCQNGKR